MIEANKRAFRYYEYIAVLFSSRAPGLAGLVLLLGYVDGIGGKPEN